MIWCSRPRAGNSRVYGSVGGRRLTTINREWMQLSHLDGSNLDGFMGIGEEQRGFKEVMRIGRK